MADDATPALNSSLVRHWPLFLFVLIGGPLIVAYMLMVRPFTIPSQSMEPTLQRGDYMLALNGRSTQRGDLAVFRLPRDGRTFYISRIIGLPGDRVQLRDGVVFLNGRSIPRVALGPTEDPGSPGLIVQQFRETLPEGRSFIVFDRGPQTADNTPVYVVPPRCYFMLGDNRDNALDSRFNPGPGSSATARCPWTIGPDDDIAPQLGVGYVPEENFVARPTWVVFGEGRSFQRVR